VKHVILSLILSLSLTACGKAGSNAFVSGAQFLTEEENGEIYGDLKVRLNTGNVLLPAFDIPILNTSVPGAIYGAVSMRDALPSGTQLGIRVNLSQISGLDGADGSLLPNGRAIPVVMAGGARPIAVSIQDQTRIYLGFQKDAALFGAAVVIREFDKIAQSVGAIDVFFPFQGENGIRGAAGLFSSAQSGQSGLAVFVDVASVLSAQEKMVAGMQSVSASKVSASASALQFTSQNALSNTKAYRLNQFMKKLGDRRQRLTLQ